MRISSQEQAALIHSVKKNIGDLEGVLYLYGSRTDPNKKGGDIDCVLVLDANDEALFLDLRLNILVDLKSEIGDQRVDFSVISDMSWEKESFWKTVHDSAIELIKFNEGENK